MTGEPDAGERYPRFRWLVPGRLAGAPHPDLFGGVEALAPALRERGIGAIVTLQETPLAPDPETLGFSPLFLPTPDFAPPPDLPHIVAFIDEQNAAGHGVLVHCFAGIGRTGTALCAWLLAHDASLGADAAVELLRREYLPDYARSRFPESQAQELALRAFAAERDVAHGR